MVPRTSETSIQRKFQMMTIMNTRRMLATALLLTVLIPGILCAENAHDEHAGAHDFHSNVLGLFGGITSEDRREGALTFGIEYERRFNQSFGLGVVAERATGDLDFWVYAMPIAFHTGPWKLYIAPGVEDSDHHGSEFPFRVGAEYAFDMGKYELAPQVDIDFVNGEQVYVLGLVVARGF